VTENPEQVQWRVDVSAGVELAEHPIWDDATDTLVWVDVLGGNVHRTGSTEYAWSAHLGAVVGAAGLRRGGGLIVAVDEEFAFLDAAGRPDRDRVRAPVGVGTRFNDAACDPGGRFLAGTAALDGTSSVAQLLQLQPDGRIDVLLEGLVESNGLDWSSDGTTLYFVDSGDPCIRRYDYDVQTGRLGPRRADLATFSQLEGVPDGLTVDSEGDVWVALWQGGVVRRYASDGRLRASLAAPVSQPTCPGFGGSKRDRLYLASGWEGMSAEARLVEPLAGCVLSADVQATGRPAYRFG